MLKSMQKEPSWNYVLHFIIYFFHFSFSGIRKYVSMQDENFIIT